MSITVKQYEDISIRGLEANQKVRGVVRGGHVFQGFFYYPSSVNVGILKVPAENFTTAFDDEAEKTALHQKSFNKEG